MKRFAKAALYAGFGLLSIVLGLLDLRGAIDLARSGKADRDDVVATLTKPQATDSSS